MFTLTHLLIGLVFVMIVLLIVFIRKHTKEEISDIEHDETEDIYHQTETFAELRSKRTVHLN